MLTHFFIRQGRSFDRVEIAEIYYLEACKNYTKIWMKDSQVMASLSLKNLGDLLPSNEFCRIHRGFVVSLRHLVSFNHAIARVGGMEVPVGESGYAALKAKVPIFQGPASAGQAERDDAGRDAAGPDDAEREVGESEDVERDETEYQNEHTRKTD